MKKVLLPFIFIVIYSLTGYSQRFSNDQGREVLFMSEPNEMAMYELYVDPTNFGCECETIILFFHGIENNKYITDDGNVEMILNDKSLNIKVFDESECCYVKKGFYTLEN